MMKQKNLGIGSLIGCLMLVTADLTAATITLTHTGTGSGSINGIAFSDEPFTITESGNTMNRSSFWDGYYIDNDSAEISISGVGTYHFIDPTRTFVSNSSICVGFSRAGTYGADLFDGPMDSAFGTWSMLNSIGPISGSGYLMQWWNGVATDGGLLILDNGMCDSTFQATVSGVPDCGLTIAMLGGTFAFFGFIGRKILK